MTRVTPDLTTERALAWEGCLNARDLGGLTTVDGRRTRPAALIRSDTLCRLSPVGRAALIAHGVRTVVDVRFPSEIERDDPAHPFRDGPDGVLYLNRPTNVGHTAEEEAAMVAGIRAAESRLELNVIDLDANRAGFASIATAIARAPAGGVVVHCHAGKDRTGIAIALVLSLVGVPDETIAADYALSGREPRRADPRVARRDQPGPGRAGAPDAAGGSGARGDARSAGAPAAPARRGGGVPRGRRRRPDRPGGVAGAAAGQLNGVVSVMQ